MRTNLTHRQRAAMQRKATARAVAKWFLPPEAAPYASLEGIRSTGGTRRPFNYV